MLLVRLQISNIGATRKELTDQWGTSNIINENVASKDPLKKLSEQANAYYWRCYKN